MRKKLLLNASTGVVQVLVNSGITLVTIPIFLSILGREQYGVYALITTIGMVGYFINFGFNIGLIKFIGQQGKGPDSDRDILVSLSLASTLILIVVAIGLSFSSTILNDVLYVPPELRTPEVRTLYSMVLMANIFLFIGEIPVAVLDAQQKIYITNILQMFNTVLSRGGILLVLLLGGDLASIGWVLFGASCIWFICICVAFIRSWQFTSVAGFWEHYPAAVRKQISYGYRVYLTGISTLFYEPFTKVLISQTIGVAEVGIFDIAFKLKNVVWSIFSRLLYPITPYLAATADDGKVQRLVDGTSRLILYMAIPLMVVVYFVVPPVIRIWIGSGSELVVLSTVTILSGYIWTMASLPIYQYLLVKNLPEMNLVIQIGNAMLSYLFFIATVPMWGYPAAVGSFVAAVLCTNVLSNYLQVRYLASNVFRPVWKIGRALGIALIVMLLDVIIVRFTPVDAYAIVLLLLSDLTVMILLGIRWGLIPRDDLQWFIGQVRQSMAFSKPLPERE